MSPSRFISSVKRRRRRWPFVLAAIALLGAGAALAAYLIFFQKEDDFVDPNAEFQTEEGPAKKKPKPKRWKAYKGAFFNNPHVNADRFKIERRLIDTIRHTQKGATIRIAVYSFDREGVADALIAAHRRGVKIQMLLNDHQDTHAMKRVRAALGSNRFAKSFIYKCKQGCRTFADQYRNLHSKFYTFTEAGNKELSLVMLQAYNDWAIDEWCAAYPGRFIPQGIVPMWDVDLAVAEVHRLAAKGCRSVSFLEAPHAQGFPSFLSGHWDPMIQALSDTNQVLSLHIGAGFDLIQKPPEAPIDHLIILSAQITALIAQDLLFGPTLRQFPDLKVALSEGGIGWIPFYLDRADRHFENQAWLANDFGGKKPSDVFKRHFTSCFIDDAYGLRNLDLIGEDNVMYEVDYPHSDTPWPNAPEVLWKSVQHLTDSQIDKITHLNAMRAFNYDPFTHIKKEEATVGALRAQATDVTTSGIN